MTDDLSEGSLAEEPAAEESAAETPLPKRASPLRAALAAGGAWWRASHRPGKRSRDVWTRATIVFIYAAAVLPYVHSGIRETYRSYMRMHYVIFQGPHGFQNAVIEGCDRYLAVNYILLLFVPLLLILLAFRESVEEYGLGRGDAHASWRIFWIFFVPTFVVLAIFARTPDFQGYYPIYQGARYHWRELIYWEIAYNAFYMFCWEFFFRGFVLFALHRAIGNWAILLQAIAFGFMHYGKPSAEFYVSFLTGIALGVIALRTRSFLATFALHMAAATSFDLMVLAWGMRL